MIPPKDVDITTVYKLVRIDNKDRLVSLTYDWPYSYRVGLWSRGTLPVLAFRTLSDVDVFVEDNRSFLHHTRTAIYEADAIGVINQWTLLRATHMSRGKVRAFWTPGGAESHASFKKYQLMDAPYGTVRCDRIRLMERIVRLGIYGSNRRD